MNPFLSFQAKSRTAYIKLDTRKCMACWHCLTRCPVGVIGKIDLPWHRHAVVINPSACRGCLRCQEICINGAFSVFDRVKFQKSARRDAILRQFIVNNLVLIAGVATMISGLILQVGFHIGGDRGGTRRDVLAQVTVYEQIRAFDPQKMVWGLNYYDWSLVHKTVIVAFSLLMIFHIKAHWKWYTGVLSRHLFRKNGGVLILTLLFVLVAVTGIVPWIIDLLSSGKGMERMIFIEIHDKLSLLLIVYMILHVAGRWKWFGKTIRKRME